METDVNNPLFILPMCAKAWDQEVAGPRENAITVFTGMCSDRDTFIVLLPPSDPWFDMTALIALADRLGCIAVPVTIADVTKSGVTMKVRDGFTLESARRAVIPVDLASGIALQVIKRADIALTAATA